MKTTSHHLKTFLSHFFIPYHSTSKVWHPKSSHLTLFTALHCLYSGSYNSELLAALWMPHDGTLYMFGA